MLAKNLLGTTDIGRGSRRPRYSAQCRQNLPKRACIICRAGANLPAFQTKQK